MVGKDIIAFPCTACGLCCRSIGSAVRAARQAVAMEEATELLREVALFPYKWDATGRCEKLNENNRCVVYDKRPAICSISSNWKKHHSEIPLLEYYKRAAAACNAMIEAAGLDETFKVHI